MEIVRTLRVTRKAAGDLVERGLTLREAPHTKFLYPTISVSEGPRSCCHRPKRAIQNV